MGGTIKFKISLTPRNVANGASQPFAHSWKKKYSRRSITDTNLFIVVFRALSADLQYNEFTAQLIGQKRCLDKCMPLSFYTALTRKLTSSKL